MLLSRICHPSVAGAPPCYVGVQADCTNPTAPPGLRTIGLRLMKPPPPKQIINDSDLDAVLSLCIQGVEVVIELPFAERTRHRLDAWMRLAANAGVSLSLLPPTKPDDIAKWPPYAEWLVQATTEYMNNRAFTGAVYPLTDHIQHLLRRAMRDETKDVADEHKNTHLTTTNPYTSLAFAVLPNGLVTRWQQAVREALYAHLGGAAGVRHAIAGQRSKTATRLKNGKGGADILVCRNT